MLRVEKTNPSASSGALRKICNVHHDKPNICIHISNTIAWIIHQTSLMRNNHQEQEDSQYDHSVDTLAFTLPPINSLSNEPRNLVSQVDNNNRSIFHDRLLLYLHSSHSVYTSFSITLRESAAVFPSENMRVADLLRIHSSSSIA